MGRQIRFYMTADDERLFLDWLRSISRANLVAEASPSPGVDPEQYPADPAKPNSWFYLLWNPDISSEPTRRFVGGRYLLDRPGLVEFSRVFIDPNDPNRGPRCGRLYLDNWSSLPSPELTRWYNRMVAWIRRKYRKDKWSDWWGPGAQVEWQSWLEG